MFSGALKKIISKENLSEEMMMQLMDELFDGKFTEAQIGALMAALATKGETAEEVSGAARSMRTRAKKLQVVAPTIVDTCGTGGDGAHTFNISTTTAFVVAGCGVTVAKHGNRSVSSSCGSADVLEALGVKLDVPPELVEEAIHDIGIGFLFAPLYHSAMKHAAKPRRELGVRSIFNMLGPLTNPAGAHCQLIGVYAPELTEMFAHALRHLGARRAFIVHGHDGLDEISVCAPTRVTELTNGVIKTYDIYPEHYFGERADDGSLDGGSPTENAAILRAILDGSERGPKRNVVVLNSAFALMAAGKAQTVKEGLQMAEHSIDSGAALGKLNALIELTQ